MIVNVPRYLRNFEYVWDCVHLCSSCGYILAMLVSKCGNQAVKYVLVISQYKWVILVITRVQGEAEDEG